MGIMSLILRLFGADVAAPPDAMKLDGTNEATLARSLSALRRDHERIGAQFLVTFRPVQTLSERPFCV